MSVDRRSKRRLKHALNLPNAKSRRTMSFAKIFVFFIVFLGNFNSSW